MHAKINQFIWAMITGARIIETVFRDLTCFNNHHDHKEEKHERVQQVSQLWLTMIDLDKEDIEHFLCSQSATKQMEAFQQLYSKCVKAHN